MSLLLYSYNESSEGAKQLAQTLGIKRIKHTNSSFKGGPQHTIINWGSSKCPDTFRLSKIINYFTEVALVADKLNYFRIINDNESHPRIPPWTVDLTVAAEWVTKGSTVCCRTILNGHSANGLVLATSLDELVQAPLYTRYIKKKDEYRVHITFGEVIDVQRKALRSTDDNGEPVDKSQVDFRIRNLANGFIYVRHNFDTPEDVLIQAVRAYKVSGLHFGAVDVIYNEAEDKAYVLEINTAPGLCGSTVQSYANAFKKELLS
jgi:hypothetical protein